MDLIYLQYPIPEWGAERGHEPIMNPIYGICGVQGVSWIPY